MTDDPRRVMLDRVRAHLGGHALREKAMFGTVAVMADDLMAVAVHRDGGLLVRVDPDEDDELVARPHASRAQMGPDRSMGPGWITVDADGVASDAALATWMDAVTRNHARVATAKTASVGDRRRRAARATPSPRPR